MRGESGLHVDAASVREALRQVGRDGSKGAGLVPAEAAVPGRSCAPAKFRWSGHPRGRHADQEHRLPQCPPAEGGFRARPLPRKAGEIESSRGIHARHLGRLAADQRSCQPACSLRRCPRSRREGDFRHRAFHRRNNRGRRGVPRPERRHRSRTSRRGRYRWRRDGPFRWRFSAWCRRRHWRR